MTDSNYTHTENTVLSGGWSNTFNVSKEEPEYNISSLNVATNLDTLLKIKDIDVSNSRIVLEYQRINTYIKSCTSMSTLIDYFNILNSCKMNTYGYKLCRTIVEYRLMYKSFVIVENGSSINITEEISDENFTVFLSGTGVEVDKVTDKTLIIYSRDVI